MHEKKHCATVMHMKRHETSTTTKNINVQWFYNFGGYDSTICPIIPGVPLMKISGDGQDMGKSIPEPRSKTKLDLWLAVNEKVYVCTGFAGRFFEGIPKQTYFLGWLFTTGSPK